MKRLIVSFDDEAYEDLRQLAFEKSAPMARLVRYAIEKTFQDDLDRISGQRGLQEYLRDPTNAITLDELLEKYQIELPGRRHAAGRQKPPSAAGGSAAKNRRRAGAA